ncbi:MAG TPA: LacI family DNA-binding transcriptional regulator [Trebonia sp.]
MKDVASRAGVALKTVSRVVNREPGVTPETAKRVHDAIDDLGFRRNESARLLRTGRTATLGFLTDTWADPEHTAVYQGLENIAVEHGYLLYSGSTANDHDREERLALAMCARRVDGLVIIPSSGPHDYLAPEIEAGVAMVFVLRPPEPVLADVVLPDERGGAHAAITYLAAQGHRRIGFLGAPGYRSQTLRAGYLEAMTSAGLTVNPAWLGLTAEGLAGADVTAVFCADQPLTRAALRALATRGVAVVGFGDFDLADLVSPPVTMVRYDPPLIGRTAGELLFRRLAGDRSPPRRVEVPVRLIALLSPGGTTPRTPRCLGSGTRWQRPPLYRVPEPRRRPWDNSLRRVLRPAGSRRSRPRWQRQPRRPRACRSWNQGPSSATRAAGRRSCP